MKRKILYIEICEKIESYKKIDLYKYIKNNKISKEKLIKDNKVNLFQFIKNVKENRAIRDIKYNIKILKLRILAKFNLIQEIEDETKITYIIYTNKGKEEKIIKKVNFLIKQNKDKIVVLSKQIKQMFIQRINNENNKQASKKESKIAEIIEYYENNKYLYSKYIQQILNSIIRIEEKTPEEQSIYILIKSSNLQYINQIIKMVSNYKIINIITPNINHFKKLEENLENSQETITILNNKRKSLSRAKYIINVDFTMQEIEEYNINRTAIIFNTCEIELKNIKNFDGIIIKNIILQTMEQEKYNLQDEYIAKVLNKEEISFELDNKIENRIERQQFKIIGNNGIIDFKQLKILF